MIYNIAIVKFNNGNGALLCNRCYTIIKTGFGFEDKTHYCTKCNGKRSKSKDRRK